MREKPERFSPQATSERNDFRKIWDPETDRLPVTAER